jgi:hypothetical protein
MTLPVQWMCPKKINEIKAGEQEIMILEMWKQETCILVFDSKELTGKFT